MEGPPNDGQHGPPSPSDNMARAQEIGQKAYGATKEATGHAISALRILFSDPMGGQGKALTMLGDAKALSAGLVFISAFVISAFVFGRTMLFGPLKYTDASVGFGAYFSLAILALVPAGALWAGFTLIAKQFKGRASRNANIFLTGVALLPTAAAFLGMSILGWGNIELILLVGLFGATLTILLLNSALLDVVKLSTQKVILLVPTQILAMAYLTKVMTVILFDKSM